MKKLDVFAQGTGKSLMAGSDGSLKTGVRLDQRSGQYYPTINGVDLSPTSFDESRALEIAENTVKSILRNNKVSRE